MSRVFALAMLSLVFGMLIFGCAGQRGNGSLPPIPVPPATVSLPAAPGAPAAASAANCAGYSVESCPSSCVVCPPCAECSSISCNSTEFCRSIGFESGWYEGIRQNLAASTGSLYALHAPQYATLGGKPTLFYEIYLANRSMDGAKKLEVLDGDRVLMALDEAGLNLSVRVPSGGINDYAIYMWVPLAEGEKPASISHKLYFEGGKALEGAKIGINYAAPIAISPPVYGDNWLAAEAPVNTNHHRKGLFAATAIAPTPVVGQRYAIDWMLYGQNGKLYRTNGMTNEDWWNYGEEIHAVADGTIVEAHDGIPSNEVGVEPKPVTLLYVAGNNVVQKIGNGSAYALYAHMIPGSLRVRIGDKVKRGDVLGLLGNTGNSGAPHLHFHLDTSMDVLFGEGVPYVMDYQYLGNTNWKTEMENNAVWNAPSSAPVPMGNGMPVDGDIVSLTKP